MKIKNNILVLLIAVIFILSSGIALAKNENSNGQGANQQSGNEQIMAQGQGSAVTEQEREQERLQDGTGNDDGDMNRNQVRNTENSDDENDDSDNSDQVKRSEQRRSQVANAVQQMLMFADRDGGIGQQVRTVAQNQERNQERIEEGLQKIQKRGSLVRFFIGANYSEIESVQDILDENQARIDELNQTLSNMADGSDKDMLLQQINTIESVNSQIKDNLDSERKGFSLFGWLFKMFSK